MAELITKPSLMSVEAFLETVADEHRRMDCYTVLELMKKVTGEDPKMWSESIVGFGTYHYKYASGREGDWFRTGFSPRKQNLTLYIMSGFEEYKQLLTKLGKYKTGKACLYINTREDVDLSVLQELIAKSLNRLIGK